MIYVQLFVSKNKNVTLAYLFIKRWTVCPPPDTSPQLKVWTCLTNVSTGKSRPTCNFNGDVMIMLPCHYKAAGFLTQPTFLDRGKSGERQWRRGCSILQGKGSIPG